MTTMFDQLSKCDVFISIKNNTQNIWILVLFLLPLQPKYNNGL